MSYAIKQVLDRQSKVCNWILRWYIEHSDNWVLFNRYIINEITIPRKKVDKKQVSYRHKKIEQKEKGEVIFQNIVMKTKHINISKQHHKN